MVYLSQPPAPVAVPLPVMLLVSAPHATIKRPLLDFCREFCSERNSGSFALGKETVDIKLRSRLICG